jgi:F0F1-type ATP synthase delta subunit
MEQTNLIDPIIYLSITTNQAIRRIRVVKAFVNFILFENKDQKDFDRSLVEFAQDREKRKLADSHLQEDILFIRSLGIQYFSQFTAKNIGDIFSEVDKRVDEGKIITLYIPFNIPEDELAKLGGWFKSNLGNTTLLDISYDPNIIGGCAISYKGVYKDYSLREKINQNKNRILESLVSYNSSQH